MPSLIENCIGMVEVKILGTGLQGLLLNPLVLTKQGNLYGRWVSNKTPNLVKFDHHPHPCAPENFVKSPDLEPEELKERLLRMSDEAKCCWLFWKMEPSSTVFMSPEWAGPLRYFRSVAIVIFLRVDP
jgi:hypothetical protein